MRRVPTIKSTAVLVALLMAQAVLRCEEPKDVFYTSFARVSLMAVPGKIMDKDVICILDTGSSTCVMDTKFAASVSKSLGAEQVRTASGLLTVPRFEKIAQRLMAFPQRTGPAVALDLSRISVATGMQIDAILGIDYLRYLFLNVSNGTPGFSDKAEISSGSGVKSYPLSVINGCPYTDVNLPVLGERPFLIDTGSVTYCGITRNYASQLVRANDAMLLEEIPTLDASGVRKTSLYVIREIKVFGVTMYNVPAEESDVNGIGLGLMRHFNFSVDFQNSVAHVLPPTPTRSFFYLDASGLRLVFKPELGHVLRRIVPDSPAEKNHFQVGDQILEIDGRNSSEMSAWEIRELLSQAGKTISIKSQRGDEVRDIQLPLSRKFEYPPKWKPRSTQADHFQKFIESESIPAPE